MKKLILGSITGFLIFTLTNNASANDVEDNEVDKSQWFYGYIEASTDLDEL